MSNNAKTKRHILASLLLITVVDGTAIAAVTGEAELQTPTAEPLRFQRILVPADRPEDWPRDKSQRYLPMPADEFERRVQQLHGTDEVEAKLPPARLVRAEYAAELLGDSLTTGTAIWQFDHRGSKREVVSLESCRLAIEDAQWIDSTKPAILGNDRDGRLFAVIESPGKMRCRWSLKGQSSSTGGLQLDLSLPQCPASSLRVTMPANLVPTVDHGLASLVSAASAETKQRVWQIELGGHSKIRLQIVPEQSPRSGQTSLAVRNQFAYEFSERGIELNADFRLDVPADSVQQVKLLADQSLTIVSAQLGGSELTVPLSSSTADGFEQISLAFPEPISGSDHRLRIKAMAPLKHGVPQRLPLIRIDGARWQQGTASLVFASPLVLEDLNGQGCRQLAAESQTAPVLGEAISLQFFSDTPQVDFQLSPRRDRVEVTDGTSITLRANQSQGHLRAELTAISGQHFVLEADVAPQWIIDTVEATPLAPRLDDAPPAAPEDYVAPESVEPIELVEDWSFASPRGRRGKLKIEMKSPLTSQRGVALKIAGRRRRAPSREALSIDDLRMLEFIDAKAIHRIVHVQAAEGFQIQSTDGDNLHRLEAEHLSPADTALLDDSPNGLIFLDDDEARNLFVSLVAQPPKYSADIRVEAHLHEDMLTESYRIAIAPQGQDVDRLIVRFTQPREEPVRWQVVDEPTIELTSRRLSANEQTAQGLVEGEAWEVKLPALRNKRFTLQATRDRQFRGDTPIALASIVGAETQQGSVQIRSSGRALPEIRSRRLKSIPAEPAAPEQVANILAAFQFDPEESSLVSAEPPLVVASRLEPPLADAWIWQAGLESRYHVESAEHVLTCRVESAGRDQIRFQLPPGAELRGAWIDDRSVLDPIRAASQSCSISLPAGVRFVTIALHWVDESARLRHLTAIRAPWPDCNAPMLTRQWNIALPPGEEIVDANFGNGLQASAPWSKRLFGPLARTNGSGPVLPTIAVDREESPADSRTTSTLVSNTVKLPWKTDLKDRFSDLVGWTTYRLDSPGDQAPKLWVANQRSALAWFWAALTIAAAIRWWIGERRLAVEIGILVLATALTFIVPGTWINLSAAVWLAIVLTQVCIWLGPRLLVVRSANSAKERSTLRRNLAAAATIATLLLFAFGQQRTSGQDTLSETTAAVGDSAQAQPPVAISDQASPLLQVLTPVDEDGKPTGGLYYLSESLHSKLMKQTALEKLPPAKYLISNARYEAEVHRDRAGKALATGTWKAAFAIESLADVQVAELSLGFDGATLEPDGLRLDGQPVGFRSNEDSHSLLVELPKAGRHQLEILFRPQHNFVGYDFAIPPVANSQFYLTAHGDVSPIVSSAIGTKFLGEMQRSAIALGPAQRIVLQETATAEPSTAEERSTAAFEYDQLGWLRIRPSAVTFDVRYKLKVRQGRLSRLRITADPRLRLMPTAEGAAAPKYQVSESKPGAIVVEWPEPIVGQTTIDLSFMLSELTGIGNHYLPALEIQAGRAVRRLWAISVDPTLEYTEQSATGLTNLPADEFIAAWGANTSKPQISLLQSGNNSVDWQLAVRPVASSMTASYKLAAIAEPRSVEVRLLANVTCDDPLFQYHLQVPENLEIEEISTDGETAELKPLRWARCRTTIVTIFLDNSVTGTRKLLLRGRVALPRSGLFTLPEVRLEDCQRETFETVVLRRPEALVEITDLAGAAVLDENEATAVVAQARQQAGVLSASALATARAIAVINGNDKFRPASMKIQRNVPRASATQLTSLVRQADRWQAAIDLDLRIRSGLIDELRFDLPPTWIGPFEITPNIPHIIDESPTADGAGKQLVIRPESPLSGNLRLRIAGPLALAPGQRPAAPQVVLHRVGLQAHYFLLPRRIEQQQLSWDTSGLTDKPLPEGWLPAGLAAENYRSLQQAGDRYRAELRSVERGAGKLQVRLADFSLVQESDGSNVGVAAFDLEPAGSTSCPLELPEGSQLYCVRLDGLPAQISPQGDNRWTIWLGDTNLPHRLEVVYRKSNLHGSSNSVAITTPFLPEVPVERTLLTISAPAGTGVAVLRSGTSISKLQHALFRYECAMGLLESADTLLQDEAVENIGRWFVPWAERLHLRHTWADEQKGLAMEEAVAEGAAVLTNVENEQARFASRLGVSDVLAKVLSSRPTLAEPADVLSSVQTSGRAISYGMLTGGEPSLQVDFPQRAANPAWRQFVIVFTTLFIGGVLAFFTGRRNIRVDDVPYLPEAFGMLVGLGWWIWVTPAVVGPMIVAASALAAWRSRRTSQPVIASRGSTITRVVKPSHSSRIGRLPR